MVQNKQLIIDSIELTNICNLKCNHCPIGMVPKEYGDGVNYPKGFLSIENFLTALKYSIPDVALSLHGESLLHPHILAFIEIAHGFGKRTGIHTNGLLLTDTMCNKLIDSGISRIQVSIHTEESIINYKRLFDINEQRGKPISVKGEFLTCEAHNTNKWINNNGLEEKHCKTIAIGPTHNWALDAPAENNYMQRCSFISNNSCVMKWDGTIVSCCFDFECINAIGHVDNFASLRHRTDYKLCKTCSPAWVNQNNVWWWKLAKGRDY